jgi:hypothetical protein
MRLASLPLAGSILLGLVLLPRPLEADELRSATIPVTVVDEKDNLVGGIKVRSIQYVEDGDDPVVTADAAGTCRIPRPLSGRPLFLHLIATDGIGQRQGYLETDLRDPEEDGKPLRIVLKVARRATIRVTDPTGAPIGDALVELIGGRPRRDLAHGRTDKDGSVRLLFPADAVVGSVFALKSGQGFDCWSAARGDDEPEEQEHRHLPEALTLTLDGAQTVRVQAVDSAGKPVPELTVRPWGLIKRGRPPIVNFDCIDMRTDKQGVAIIDWLPVDFKQVSFRSHSASHVPVRMPQLLKTDVKPGTIPDVTISVLRLTKISGRVKGADGKPAVGIHVRAARASCRTGADGMYEMNVRPETVYMVSVVDDEWAAPARGRVVVREDEAVGGIDLELTKGTVISGTVTRSRDNRPAARESVTIEQIGEELPPELQVLGDRAKVESFARSVMTDAKGRFEFRVGPGTYVLTNAHAAELRPRRPGFGPAQKEQVRLIVEDEPEIVADLQAVGLETAVLTGTVAGPDGVAVRDGLVTAFYISDRVSRGSMRSVIDASGAFRLERQLLPVWLFAFTADKALSGRLRVAADQESVTVQLAPTATVVGRLIDGDASVAGAEVGVHLPLDDNPGAIRTASRFFEAGAGTTAADGRFVFPGLIVGEQYDVRVDRPDLLRVRLVVTADRPGNIDLGYVALPPPRRLIRGDGRGMRVETDFEKLTFDRFGDKTGVAGRVAAALADARREYRRVLLVLGEPQAQSTQMLMKIVGRIEAGPDLMRTMANFGPVYINAKDRDAAAHLNRTYQLDVSRVDLPALVILDENGTVAARQSFLPASDPAQLDLKALGAFLKLGALSDRNAEEVLRAAQRRARDEKKLILLQQTDANSYPCRLLTRFIDEHRALLERDYVYVNLDVYRSLRGNEVMKQFREKANSPPTTAPLPAVALEIVVVPFGKTPGSVPWLAILSTDGVKLADSDDPDGNIGFPAEPEAIDYFINKMLRPTAQRLTTDQLEELRQALRGK